MFHNESEHSRTSENASEPWMNLSKSTGTPQISRNVILHFCTFWSLSEQILTHKNASDFLSTPQNFRERFRDPGACRNHESKSECLRKFSHIREHLKTFGNPLELLRTHENAAEHLRMSKNVSKTERTIIIEPFIVTPQNELERLRIPKNIREHLGTLRILSEPLRINENSSEWHQSTSQYASGNVWKPQDTPRMSKNPWEPSATFQNCSERIRALQKTSEKQKISNNDSEPLGSFCLNSSELTNTAQNASEYSRTPLERQRLP